MDGDVEYSLLGGSLNPSLDRSSREHMTSDGAGSKYIERAPLISWRTEPSFEISVNFYGIGRHILPIILALLPSFVIRSKGKKPRKLYATSYLDGLRGVAALFVVIHHYALQYTASSPQGWRMGAQGTHNWFFQLPLVRVVHSGRFMVVIFFVISGYVLSYRSLKLAREGKHEQLLDSLGSSVFRRWIRLHFPVIASTFIAFVLARHDQWQDMPAGWEHSSTNTHMAAKPVPFPVSSGTFSDQLWDWYEDAKQLCDPFRYGVFTASRFNVNVLWTIPIEWMGSMLVFTVVLSIARTKTWVKLTVLSYLIYWCHQTTRWEPATFLTGVLLAELSFMYSTHSESSTSTSLDTLNEKAAKPNRKSKIVQLASRIFFTFLFILGIYLGSQPQEGTSSTPGYRTIMRHIPTQYMESNDSRHIFWLAVAGPLVVFALEQTSYLQSIFTTSFAQYLGDISFSLYMMHVQVEFTMGNWLVPKCMNLTGGWENGQFGFIAGMGLALLVLMPITIWISDVFSRGVDERCVRFARWVSERCFVKL